MLILFWAAKYLTSKRKGDVEAETPILWPPDAKS